MARSVAFLVVLLAVFEIGLCTKCYQCNTQSDQGCKDPFKPGNQLIDCGTKESVEYNQRNLYQILPAEVFGSVAGAPRYCHKIIMETGTVIRTCLDGNPADMNHTCQSMKLNSRTATSDKKIKECAVCDKDGCNGAASLSYSLPLAFVALVASYLLYKQ